MRSRTALALAIASGAAAVALVAIDLEFTLMVRIDSMDDGAWETLAVAPYDDRYNSPRLFEKCASQSLRVVVDNHRPLGARVDLLVTVTNASGGTSDTLYESSLDLAAFEERPIEVTVPDAAFEAPDGGGASSKPVEARPHLSVQMGREFIGVCVQREAST